MKPGAGAAGTLPGRDRDDVAKLMSEGAEGSPVAADRGKRGAGAAGLPAGGLG